jgi:rod shape determining protein RodA
MISSIAPNLVFKQLIAWVLGIILFFVGKQINLKQLSSYKWPIFIGSCVLLLLPIVFNNLTRGSHRWLYIAGQTIQPSELVKPWLMSFLSTTNLPLLHFIPVFIIMAQPDLGSAISIFCLIIPIILYNKKLLKLFILFGITFLLISPLVYKFGLKGYQQNRISTFLNPKDDPLGQGYNVIQSQIAIGSGGFLGKGYKKGTQGHLLFLPEKHTDFMFASTAEELGILGISIVLFAYYLLISTLFNKAFSTKNKPLFLFTLGIAIQIWMQTFVNIGMNVGLLPVTGIPRPFISVGGSSLMALLFSLGIIYSS